MKYLNVIILTGFATFGFSALAAPVDWSKLPPASKAEGVTFAKDIQPLFKVSCVQCHGTNRPKAQLNLTTLEGVLKGTKQGPIVTAGDSTNSFLVKSISQLDPESAMPPQRSWSPWPRWRIWPPARWHERTSDAAARRRWSGW